MKPKIILSNDWFYEEIKNGTIYIKGNIFLKKEKIDKNQIIDILIKSKKKNNIPEAIKNFNGFFSIIFYHEDNVILITDHIRSIPIIYALNENELIISDIAINIRENLTISEINNSAKTEIILNSFVAGDETLSKNIKQVEAGCIVIIKEKTIEKQYYNIRINNTYDYDNVEFYNKNKKILSDSIQRLINFANGRKIVIPLSAGYDSKLIATLLKKSNYNNIISYSYGRENCDEIKKSKQVANSLNIPWIFIDYGKFNFKKHITDKNTQNYMLYACNYVSLPHTQDFLAVKYLKDNNLIPNDSIFVPGHSIASAFPLINKNIDKIKSTREIVDHIYNLYYNNDPYLKKKNKNAIKNKIKEIIKTAGYYDNSHLSDVILFWAAYEDDVKFIINSIKVYEFFGYTFWLPLWDKNYSDFWMQTSHKFKYHRTWYEHFIRNQFEYFQKEKYNEDEEKPIIELPKNKENKIISLLKKITILRRLKKSIYFLFPKNDFRGTSYTYNKFEVFLLHMQGKHLHSKYTLDLINKHIIKK
ncbi:conserved hypothetical protein [Xenorhabdus bovienii str. Jollieti]|uniref:asparagine synthase (glutamine-hydrolyzing) n=1 Tax=Xenorhabdus bovienii (strain SS-2004) TaxID=406818 RepID=D3V6Z4_XENBS|nr:hypothetical protein [Xenorhabdus bovienii]CBJ83423.1 conserved hypothetical protein [Xenorhabdus bovienii SS-2004]CDH29315.1 conserved hypothetical protein [Xenorhabdus bovienii str. Jollieti]